MRQAVRRGSREDRWLTALSLAGYATPSFWLGLVLAWLVGIQLGWLPVAGMQDPAAGSDAPWLTRALDVAAHLVLPVLTPQHRQHRRHHALPAHRDARGAAPSLYSDRASQGDCRAGGPWRHAWRNALFPVITLFGLWLPILVTGSVFVEMVFAWPGLGSLAASAASSRDYPLLMGASLLAAALVVTASLLTDVAYALLDPRVRYS